MKYPMNSASSVVNDKPKVNEEMDKSIEQMEWQDIEDFVNNGIPEQIDLDYKQKLPDRRNEKSKNEFKKDICAMANSSGGFIIYGIEEGSSNKKGIAEKIVNQTPPNGWDDMIRSLELIANSNVTPRINGLRFKRLSSPDESENVLVVYIPDSWNSPHMVNKNDDLRFPIRKGSLTIYMDYQEIKDAFLMNDALTEKIRRFRYNRISKVISGETPCPIYTENPIIMLHLVPMQAFKSNYSIDLEKYYDKIREMLTMNGAGMNKTRYNFDGVLNYNAMTDGKCTSYLQAFRNSIMESVDSLSLKTGKENGAPNFFVRPDKKIEEALKIFLGFYKLIKISPPMFVLVSFLGMKDKKILPGKRFINEKSQPIDRDNLIVPEIILEDLNSNIRELTDNLVNPLWQASNFPKTIRN